MTPRPLKIDFVSDVACPWCVIGLKSLEQALDRLGPDCPATLHFQPFELNPQMPPGGQDIGEHLAQKYGASEAQLAQTQAAIRERGAALGFEFRMDRRSRIYNTFDAHRLLHWAGQEGKQQALKHALFSLYFTEGRDPGDAEVLQAAAARAGLNAERALEILNSNRYAAEVREQENYYLAQGIHSVPSVIINDRHLIQGGQAPEVFEQALRQIAAEVQT